MLAIKDALFGPDLSFQDLGMQFGGEVVDFEEGLAFVTVHRLGHMVPQFCPQALLHFITVNFGRGPKTESSLTIGFGTGRNAIFRV